MSAINRVVNTVVVGAGPVGLWTAIQTKLRCPEAVIEVLEKNNTYQRTHVLRLDADSFAGIPQNERLQGIVQRFIQNKHVRTSDIEAELSQYATELGINIRKNVKVVNPERILELYPQAKVIIGADGSHSVIREKIFHNEMYAQAEQKFVFQVKYEVEGQGRPFAKITEAYRTWKIMDAYCQESVGKEQDGKTPITLTMFIDKENFEKMREADFKHPYKFENEEQITTKVREKMWTWLNFKSGIAQEKRIPGSENITVTPLGYYASENVIQQVNGVFFALVGDAAFGVPFFRSMNNGLPEGTELSQDIARILTSKPSLKDRILTPVTMYTHGMPYPFYNYTNFIKSLRRSEIFWAIIKSIGLAIWIFFIKISARVPWQVNRWTEAQISQLPIA